MNDAILSLFPTTAAVNNRGHLVVGGCDAVELAARFGTPLYAFDEVTIRDQCRVHLSAFRAHFGDARVLYAGKAYLGIRLAQMIRDEGMGLDIVSGGEMHMARAAAFPAERICLHGNNKTAEELATALQWGIGRIVIDNLHELEQLARMSALKGVVAPVLLRLAPAVDPHTHKFIATGVADSKFGLPIMGGMAENAVLQALSSPSLRLLGYHTHIGSQVAGLEAYRQAAEVVIGFAATMAKRYDFSPAELSLGGGWAVRYTPEEAAPAITDVAATICGAVSEACLTHALHMPALSVEPGRAIVARAGVAIYTIGGSKTVPGARRYVSVDGGMADNIRPALYGARYSALLANRAADTSSDKVTVAGRYCESGDVLLWDCDLPAPSAGDILAVATCGAYTLSMASNYNLSLRPAVVGVADGKATLWRRREMYEDLVRCEV